MCGGVGFRFKRISEQDLANFYTPLEIDKFRKSGRVQSFFWQKNPALPVEDGGKVRLLPWGNRDKTKKLPQTGWTRQESLDEGKWAYLKPELVKIVAEEGWEKGVHLNFESGYLQGVMVDDEDKKKRAYMVTKQSSPNYQKKTQHNREPIEIK
jgi:hypothetical protein